MAWATSPLRLKGEYKPRKGQSRKPEWEGTDVWADIEGWERGPI